MGFHYNKMTLGVALSFFFLQGCAKTASFSPSKDGEMIHFTASIPEELEALPLFAMYRSEICRKENRTANMDVYTVPGYHSEQYPLTMVTSNKVEANIPQSGGGKCNWKLSNIKFEVKLKDPLKIDPLISKNFGAEAAFVFDNNAPATFDGGYEKKSGDINERLILFPLVSEVLLGNHEKQFWLISKYETMTYKVKKTNKINIKIDYKSNMASYWVSVKKKEKGEKSTLTYPNGDIVYGEVKPQYKKLIEISESIPSK